MESALARRYARRVAARLLTERNDPEHLAEWLDSYPEYDHIPEDEIRASLAEAIESLCGPFLGYCQGPQCNEEEKKSGLCVGHKRQRDSGKPLTPLPPGWNVKKTPHSKSCLCPACEAERARRRERNIAAKKRRALRAAAGDPAVPHGLSGYLNWNCRCTTCKEAGHKANKAYYYSVKDKSNA